MITHTIEGNHVKVYCLTDNPEKYYLMEMIASDRYTVNECLSMCIEAMNETIKQNGLP